MVTKKVKASKKVNRFKITHLDLELHGRDVMAAMVNETLYPVWDKERVKVIAYSIGSANTKRLIKMLEK